MKLKIILLFLLVYSYSILAQVNPDKDQLSAFSELKLKYKKKTKIAINWHKKNGSPEIISFSQPIAFNNDPEKSAKILLKEFEKVMKIRGNKDSWSLKKKKERIGRKYYFFQQRYNGIPVRGGEYVVAILPGGKIKNVLGSCFSGIDVDTNPVISVNAALQTALNNAPGKVTLKDSLNSSELIIYTDNNKYCWLIN